jgi:hypothetical protein
MYLETLLRLIGFLIHSLAFSLQTSCAFPFRVVLSNKSKPLASDMTLLGGMDGPGVAGVDAGHAKVPGQVRQLERQVGEPMQKEQQLSRLDGPGKGEQRGQGTCHRQSSAMCQGRSGK